MATKEISIILRAKSAMAAGLSKAGAALKSFGASAVNLGEQMAIGFLAAGTAVAGMAAKALQAYSVQERAEKSLEAAMNSRGEQGSVLIGMMKREAAAIQDATGAADEQTLATMAQLSTLGVATSKLREAAKATIALKSVGLEGASAQRAVALAMQGNYDMLQRYIPAIRNATNEQQKAAAFNDLVTRGYQQQEAELQTVGGQWNALKGRVGDVWEELGRAISQNGALVGAMQKAGNAVKRFGQRMTEFIDDGGVEEIIARVREMAESIKAYFISVLPAVKKVGEAFGWMKDRVQESAAFWGALAGGATKDEAVRAMTEIPILLKKESEAKKEAIKVERDTRKEAAKLRAEARKDRQAESMEAEQAALKEADALQELVAAEKKAADERLEIEKNLADGIKKLEDEKKQAQIDEQQKVLDAAKKKAAEQQKLAGMRVDDFIDAAKQEKNLEKAKAKEAGKAARLEEDLKRGTKLSRKQQEWLDAFNKIKDAGAAGAGAKAAVDAAQKKLEELNGKQLRELEDINHEIRKQRAELRMNLAISK